MSTSQTLSAQAAADLGRLYKTHRRLAESAHLPRLDDEDPLDYITDVTRHALRQHRGLTTPNRRFELHAEPLEPADHREVLRKPNTISRHRSGAPRATP